MVDIAEEIRGNWTSINVINKATHTQFINNAGSDFDVCEIFSKNFFIEIVFGLRMLKFVCVFINKMCTGFC
jgi:hypothetical protein